MQNSTKPIDGAKAQVKFTEQQLRNFWIKVNKDGSLPDQTNPYYKGLDRCWEWTAGRSKSGYGRLRLGGKDLRAHRVAWMITDGLIPGGMDILHRCDNPACCCADHLFLGTNEDNRLDMMAKGRQARGETHKSRTRPDSVPRGDAHYARVSPERVLRGDRHGAHLHPERRARGDKHGRHTKPERTARGDRHGSRLHPERLSRGVDVYGVKLTEDQVREIRSLCKDGKLPRHQIAKQFSIDRSSVNRIALRKTWKHVN